MGDNRLAAIGGLCFTSAVVLTGLGFGAANDQAQKALYGMASDCYAGVIILALVYCVLERREQAVSHCRNLNLFHHDISLCRVETTMIIREVANVEMR